MANHLKTKGKNSTFNLPDKERVIQTPAQAQPDGSFESGIIITYYFSMAVCLNCLQFSKKFTYKHTPNCYRIPVSVFILFAMIFNTLAYLSN